MSKKKFKKMDHTATYEQPNPVSKKAVAVDNPSQSMYYWFLGVLVLVSFAYTTKTLDPVIVPRYIVLSIFTFSYIAYFYFFKKIVLPANLPILVKILFITGILFNIWCGVSLSNSINPSAGYYDIARQLLLLALLFIGIQMLASNDGFMLRISKAVMVMGTVHAAIGIMQLNGMAFTQLPGANALPYGLMANRNLFASAETFTLPFIFLVYFLGSKIWKIGATAAALFVGIAIIVAQTRSAWLATMVMATALILLSFIFIKEIKWTVFKVLATFILALVAFTALLTLLNTETAMGLELKDRALSMVNNGADTSLASQSANDRILIWKKTAAVIQGHPITGTGLGNWKLNVLAYGSAGLAWSRGYYVPDRVHNVLIQTTAETGIPGFLLLLSFWIITAIIAYKNLSEQLPLQQKIATAIMLAGLCAVASDSMFSFPFERIEHCLYITLMGAIIIGIYYKNYPGAPANPPKRMPLAVVFLLLIIAGINIAIGFQKQLFEKSLSQVKALEKSNMPQALIDAAQAGKKGFVTVDDEGLSIEAKEALAYRDLKQYHKALNAMKIAFKYNPNSAMVNNNMGTIYTEIEDYKTAIVYYEKALALTPDFIIVKKNLALNYYLTGNYAKCISILNTFDYSTEPTLVDMMVQSQNLLMAAGGK